VLNIQHTVEYELSIYQRILKKRISVHKNTVQHNCF